MKQALLLALSMLTLLTIGISANAGKIFRWQDDAGTWHYSATPPSKQQAETISIKAPPTSGPSKEQSEDEDESDQQTEGTPKEKTKSDSEIKKSAEVAAEDKALAQKNCENARANLANLENHRRLRINDEETGEIRYLGDDEHNEWMERSREEVRKYCQ